MCPASSVVASTFRISVSKLKSSIATNKAGSFGPPSSDSCSYLTSAYLTNGRPTWMPLVYYSWPSSKSSFDAQIEQLNQLKSVPPFSKAPQFGNEVFVQISLAGTSTTIRALRGNVEIQVGNELGIVRATERQVFALAKKVLNRSPR
jgi:hypothetical protein